MKLSVEQVLVAELVMSGDKTPEVRSILADGSFFQDKECADFYESILDAYDVNGTVDLVLISDNSKQRNLDISHLSEWTTRIDNDKNLTAHARRVAEKYMKRVGSKTIAELHRDFEDNPDPFESLSESIASLNAVLSQFKRERAVSMATVAGEVNKEIESIRHGGGSNTIPFGFFGIDATTGGMESGDLVVIAGLEKRGKSTLMLQTMFHNAENGIAGLIFSTEMKRKQILFRYALIRENISWIDVKRNHLSELAWDRLSKRIQIISSYPLYIHDGVLTIADIFSESESFVKERGVKIISVDYIQRIVPISKKTNENREREISAISSGLKNIAMQFDVPVIALSQLNEDLRARESRSIEQDMDKMITINIEKDDKISDDGHSAQIGIRIKQRMGLSGGFGDTFLLYDRDNGSWKNYSSFEQSRNPKQIEETF